MVKLNNRAKPVRSQTQAIAELAKSIERNTDLQVKRAEASVAAEHQRHSEYISFKKSEAEKNRAHELELAKIYAAAMRPTVPQPTYYPEWSRQNLPVASMTMPTTHDYQPSHQSQRSMRFPTTTNNSNQMTQQYYEPPQKFVRNLDTNQSRNQYE